MFFSFHSRLNRSGSTSIPKNRMNKSASTQRNKKHHTSRGTKSVCPDAAGRQQKKKRESREHNCISRRIVSRTITSSSALLLIPPSIRPLHESSRESLYQIR
ncbi:hypothetical protein CEXT_742591 [Caerostris extrusa]|uniref:Uncharacterized protein n=1 Tax=Caerostris extrusa TaxID=172846 RepID=A0AAV4YAF2_CAEEX|nr:hypothetical protein CEXT_742591 [Caerostris extrusa]